MKWKFRWIQNVETQNGKPRSFFSLDATIHNWKFKTCVDNYLYFYSNKLSTSFSFRALWTSVSGLVLAATRWQFRCLCWKCFLRFCRECSMRWWINFHWSFNEKLKNLKLRFWKSETSDFNNSKKLPKHLLLLPIWHVFTKMEIWGKLY